MSSWPAAIRHSCWPEFRPRLLLGAHPDRPDEESRRSSFGASARNRRHTPPPPRARNSTDDDFSAVEPPSRAENSTSGELRSEVADPSTRRVQLAGGHEVLPQMAV